MSAEYGAPVRPRTGKTLPPSAARALAAQELARGLFAQSPFSTVIYDAEGHLLAANAAFEELWGVSPDTAPPGYSVLHDPELERQGTLTVVRRAFAGEVVVTPPVRYDISKVSATGAGRTLWTQGHFYPIFGPDGGVTHVVLAHVDLTARVEVEEALRRRTEDFERQVEEARALNARLERANEELQRAASQLAEARDAAERAADWAGAEARRLATLQELTLALAQAVSDGDVAAVALELARPAFAAAGGSVALLTPDGAELVALRVEGFSADQREPWCRYPLASHLPSAEAMSAGAPVFVSSLEECSRRFPGVVAVMRGSGYESFAVLPLKLEGNPIGVLAFAFREPRAFDADDRAQLAAFAGQCALAMGRARRYDAERAARSAAEAASRAKSEFLATMSHELRTPLNAIDGYAELLELDVHGPLTAAQREDVARIRRSQKHLLALIEDVLSFARLEAGRVELQVEPVRLDDVLVRVEELVAPQLSAKGLRYDYHRPAADVRVLADAERLHQAVLNLLSNAVKFTDAGGVTVGVEVAADEVAVLVTDTGRGIPEDKLAVIFEPFVQVERGLTRTTTGSGLGLAIARDLARRMGGDITARSAPGRGATFIVTLRRAP